MAVSAVVAVRTVAGVRIVVFVSGAVAVNAWVVVTWALCCTAGWAGVRSGRCPVDGALPVSVCSYVRICVVKSGESGAAVAGRGTSMTAPSTSSGSNAFVI